MDKNFTSYHVEERSFVSYVKREIHNEVVLQGFSETRVAEIDIIVSEITSNLIKYAGSGDILYRTTINDKAPVFEIICIDKGPGIADVSKMMKDGVSTKGTLGHGLGAIERLSNLFQIYSIPGWGTIVYSKVTTTENKFLTKRSNDLEIKGINVPKPREIECGDGFCIKHIGEKTGIFFGDGLGHGPQAHEAVKKACGIFFECNEYEPVGIIRKVHEGVRRTRGLVATVAIFDPQQNNWTFCGVGNILTRLYHGLESKTYMAYNGTIGLNIPNSMKDMTVQSEKNQYLVMCSDGLLSRWEINKYPAILKCDVTVLSAALYKDFTRGTDDSSVLIAKTN